MSGMIRLNINEHLTFTQHTQHPPRKNISGCHPPPPSYTLHNTTRVVAVPYRTTFNTYSVPVANSVFVLRYGRKVRKTLGGETRIRSANRLETVESRDVAGFH